MTTSKHTPGGWYAQQTLIPVGGEVSWAVLCEKDLNAGYVVAMCYGPDAEANAQAIVAAEAVNRKLLEALEWLVNIGYDVGKDGGRPKYGEFEDAILSAQRAIAKATGGNDDE